MAKKAIFKVLRLQRLAQQRIGAKIDHARRQIIAGSPVRIDLPQFFRRKRCQDFSCVGHQIFSHHSGSSCWAAQID